MKSLVTRFTKNESGATAIEYGLITAFVALVIITGLTMAGPALKKIFDDIGTTLEEKAGTGTKPVE